MNKRTTDPESAAPLGASAPPWRRLAFFALLGGSTSLIPIPFIDDWTLDWVRRRMILDLARSWTLPEDAVRVLLRRGQERLQGCFNLLIRTPISLLIYVLKRLFRKIFFFLAVKESTDRASLVFHEGYLLAAAAALPRLNPRIAQGEPEAVRQLAFALAETFLQTDTSPIRFVLAQTLKGSRRVLFTAVRRLRRMLPKTSRLDAEPAGWQAEEESLLGELARELADALEQQRQYFERLESVFAAFAQGRGVLLRSGEDSSADPRAGPFNP